MPAVGAVGIAVFCAVFVVFDVVLVVCGAATAVFDLAGFTMRGLRWDIGCLRARGGSDNKKLPLEMVRHVY